MANDSIEICPADKRYPGFHPLRTDGVELQYAGLTDTVVVVQNAACVYDTNGGIALGTDGGLTNTNFAGVSTAAGGSATASANASTKVPFYIPNPHQLFWVENLSGTAAAATDVGEIVDLESEVGVDVTDVTTGGLGFKIIAVDTTNDYVKGYFAIG